MQHVFCFVSFPAVTLFYWSVSTLPGLQRAGRRLGLVAWFNKHGSFFTPSAPRFNSEHHESAATAPDEFRVSRATLPPQIARCICFLPRPVSNARPRVVSIASCLPPHKVRPFAITSMGRSSGRVECSMLRVIPSPASRHILALRRLHFVCPRMMLFSRLHV